MKHLLKSILFLLIFVVLFFFTFKILWVSKNSVSYFYDEPKNSLDVIYIGSSNAYAHFNSVLAYDLYGYTTGLLASDSQPTAIIKYLIKESEKYQTPTVYIVDIARFGYDFSDLSEGEIRKSTDSMKFSQNRLDAINDLLSYTTVKKKDYINYYFSILLYHNLWKFIANESFEGQKALYKSYLFSTMTSEIEPVDKYVWSNDVVALPENNKKILLDLIDYIKANDLNVLFVIPKRSFEKPIDDRLNYAASIIQENNLKLINFNTLDDFSVDFSTDLYNSAHLNVYGATKYTLYFSKYLKENYNLPNHKGDNLYHSWDSEYIRFKQDFKNLTKKDFDQLLTELNN